MVGRQPVGDGDASGDTDDISHQVVYGVFTLLNGTIHVGLHRLANFVDQFCVGPH